ncbi:MAG TPA: hypothetical protein VEF54_02300 [archaeon]|nr:hypothetical protein [archaeon]
MGEVTHEQVNLMLRLYDIRREPRLREAREWFMANFNPTSGEDVMRLCPPMSRENAFMRMVISYWDMVASVVNRGLIDEEFFFENNGEQWMVWERLKPVVSVWRTIFKNPHTFENLEKHVQRLEAWREKRAPGSNDAIREFARQMAQGTPKASSARS